MKQQTETTSNTGYHNPSALMSAYNYAKHYGKRTGLFDSNRVDRAFGYLMSGQAEAKWADYATTTTRCDCPDSRYRHQICKHSLAKMIDIKHDQLMAEFQEAA